MPIAFASRRRILVGFLLVYMLWGTTYLAIHYALETLPPFFLAAARFLLAGSVLYGWTRLRGFPRPKRAHWRSAAVVGILMVVGGNGGVVFAQQYVSSGLAALMVSTIPLWMVVLDWRGRASRRPSSGLWFGLALGVAGIALLVDPSGAAQSSEVYHTGSVSLVWAIVLLGASFAWAVGSLYSRKASLPESAILSTSMQMLTGGAVLLILAAWHGDFARLNLQQVSLRSWLALGYLVVFGAIIGFSTYLWLLRVASVASVSTYAFVNPLVAVTLGCLIAREPLTPRMLIASLLILSGVALIILFRRVKPR